jgi:hypothetical protein
MKKSNATLLGEGSWVRCFVCGSSTLELQEIATEAFVGGFTHFQCPACGNANEMGESIFGKDLPIPKVIVKEPAQTKLFGKDPSEVRWEKKTEGKKPDEIRWYT